MNDRQIFGTFSYHDGKYVSVSADKNNRDFSNDLAVPIPTEQIQKYYPLRSEPQVYVGNLLNRLHLKAGESYPSNKGERVIIKVTRDYVLFVRAESKRTIPSFFIQKPFGFHQDWLDVIRINAAKKLDATRVLAEWEVQFLVGVVAGLSWKGLALVIGVDIFEEAITKKKTQATKDAVRMMQVLFVFHRDLKKVAPTLASVITDIIWLSLLKGQHQHLLPAMLNDPKVAARAAGTITAQVGKQVIENRLTVSSIIWTVLSQAGIKASITVPAAISDTIKSFDTTNLNVVIEKIDEILKTVKIVLSDEEKKAIVQEVEKNPDKIRSIFLKMLKDLKTPPR